jgi:hypothetical protein
LFKEFKEMSNEYKEAFRAFEQFKNSAKYMDNPDFIKKSIHRDYWSDIDSETDSETTLLLWILIGVSVLTIISAVILIILLKYKSKGDSSGETNLTET